MMMTPIVGDLPTNRAGLPTGEINMGYAVIQACEGGEAVELHGRERPDRQTQTVLQALGLEAVAA